MTAWTAGRRITCSIILISFQKKSHFPKGKAGNSAQSAYCLTVCQTQSLRLRSEFSIVDHTYPARLMRTQNQLVFLL